MKLVICVFSLLFASIAFSKELHDYNEVKTAVAKGKLVRISVDYSKCSSEKKITVPNSAAVFTPNAMAIMANDKIGAYILYFTMQDPRHPGQAVYQYGTYIFSNDNSLKLTFTVLNAADYAPLDEKSILDCKINEGVQIFVN